MSAVQASVPEQVSVAPRPKLVTVPSTLEADDVKELRWYSRQTSLFAPTHSSFYSQLQRAALLSFGSRNCTRCGGSADPDRPGRGFLPLKPRIKYEEQLRRFRVAECRRLGFSWRRSAKEVAKLRALGLEAWTWSMIEEFYPELPSLECKECPSCKGRGVIPRQVRARNSRAITARPTGSSKHGGNGPSQDTDEASLHRRGRIDRRLARTRTRCPRVAFLLDAYYAPGAESLTSIWRFTKIGQLLLEQNHLGLTDREFFKNSRDAQKRNPDKHRAWQFDRADSEAQELLDLACRTWNEVIAEDVSRGAVDTHGRRVLPGLNVWAPYNGRLRAGRVESQAREYWLIRFAGDVLREVHGWHLEVAA